MGTIARLAADVTCASCGRPNAVLLPEASCGNEFVWHARCGSCGGWRWFHSREDGEFVRAVRETARRRGETGGLSAEGTREAHAAFESSVDPCGCGGRFHVVLTLGQEPCLGCGKPLGAVPVAAGRRVEVSPLRDLQEPTRHQETK
jgi:hypothetical protein